jgi:hypothetical protein
MPRIIPRNKWIIATVALSGLIALAGSLCARNQILAWYHVQRLIRANERDREGWAACAAEADEAAIAPLVGALRGLDPSRRENLALGLGRLTSRWAGDDARLTELVGRMGDDFPRMNLTGQTCALAECVKWVENNPSASELKRIAARMAFQAGRSSEKEVRIQALLLVSTCLKQQPALEDAANLRTILAAGLQDTEPEIRACSARLCGTADVTMLPQVAPLLDDPSPRVRQAALLAVGRAENAVCTDDLLRSLHDSDEDVRRLTEAALLSRGLRDEDVLLGRMISDSRAAVRLQVLERMGRTADLDVRVWLHRLTHDASPAVRAAAIRAAAGRPEINLSERLAQLSIEDPSPTVRQLAQHYLADQKKRAEYSSENP